MKQLIEFENGEVKDAKLTSMRVRDIFDDCLFKEEELEEGNPTKEFNVVEGVMIQAVFNTERLNQHKPEIDEMIDEIANIDKGPHFLNMCTRKDGSLWTGEHFVVDQLMVLGLATEILKVPLDIPKKEWGGFFPYGMPFVIKDQQKTSVPVIGENPKNYKTVMKLIK